MKKIEFTAKEVYLLWSLACWFDKPITSTLKSKLFALGEQTGMKYGKRSKFRKRYDQKIITQLAETGSRIKQNHPDWLEDSK